MGCPPSGGLKLPSGVNSTVACRNAGGVWSPLSRRTQGSRSQCQIPRPLPERRVRGPSIEGRPGFATDTQTHGRQPFWYYVPILLGGGLPWIAYLPALTRDAAQRRRDGTAGPTARLPVRLTSEITAG
jgi:4-amino-4-deoxy-L-arabinose transferase-like glycosyltransferase